MKARQYPQVTITKKAERAILNGHPWVYDTELLSQPDADNGALIDIISEKGAYLGTALLSTESKIRLRLLSRNANDLFDSKFFERRISYAWNYRKTVMEKDIDACRIVFGEADGLPGLTVDRFSDVLVTQVLSYGIEQRKGMIFDALLNVLRNDGQTIRGIYERNDVAIRRLEGLCENRGWYLNESGGNESTVTTICENGITYTVDFGEGQKTGFFLDQKYNRLAVSKLAKDKTVLDCFTHTGSFGLNAAKGGAKHVVSVDISESACEMARQNAKNNALDVEVVCADVFEYLTTLEKSGKHPYDFIILDPPAFTKSRKTTDSAMRGYKDINYRAMRILPRGGYLATCSCSHFATEELFRRMLYDAAHDANVQLRQIECRQQSPDHPILWGVDETNYLKFFLFQIV